VGVTEYRDATREYVEIAVLHLALRTGAKIGRLIELVHRAVPYPVLLVADYEERLSISAAHKRWSEGEEGKTVLAGELVAVEADATDDLALMNAFCEALSLRRQPRNSLLTLYQGWIDTLLAFEAARITGEFVLPRSPEQATARRDALREHARLEAEISSLRVAAESETQIPRQVELNLEIQRLRAAIVVSKKTLKMEGIQ
jgi:hypothetical protein